MKRFMKGCAIAALTLIIVGFVIALIAGTVSGKKAIKEIVESVTDGKVHVDLDMDDDEWGIFVGEDDVVVNIDEVGTAIGEGVGELGESLGESMGELGENIGEGIADGMGGTVHYDIEESMIFDNAYEILKGDVEKYSVGSDVRELDIEAGGCKFEIKTSEDENFYVEAKDIKKFQAYIKDGVLHVRGTMGTIKWNESSKSRITLYMPADYQFDQVDVELGAGVMTFDDLYADKAVLEVGAGQIKAEKIVADALELSVGMGEIRVEKMQTGTLFGEVGMGNLYLKGAVNEEAAVECAMGNLEMVMDGAQSDFNYDVECGMGNIDIGSKSYSGVAQEQSVDNGAEKNMKVECAMGNVDISFAE